MALTISNGYNLFRTLLLAELLYKKTEKKNQDLIAWNVGGIPTPYIWNETTAKVIPLETISNT